MGQTPLKFYIAAIEWYSSQLPSKVYLIKNNEHFKIKTNHWKPRRCNYDAQVKLKDVLSCQEEVSATWVRCCENTRCWQGDRGVRAGGAECGVIRSLTHPNVNELNPHLDLFISRGSDALYINR